MAQEPDIDLGAVTEALNNKTDTDGYNVETNFGAGIYAAAAAVPVVEFNRSTDWWYMIYANGWMIAGGYVGGTGTYGPAQVNFPKAFINTPYIFTTSITTDNNMYTDSNNASNRRSCDTSGVIINPSNTSFYVSVRDAKYWIAFGDMATT